MVVNDAIGDRDAGGPRRFPLRTMLTSYDAERIGIASNGAWSRMHFFDSDDGAMRTRLTLEARK